MRRVSAALLALMLLGGVVACGDDDGGDDVTATSTTRASTTTTTTESPTTTGPGAPSTEPGSPTTLPGEAFEGPPQSGARLGVVGVEAGDTLNLREGPGTDFAVASELNPLAAGLTATGRNQRLDDGSIWAEVSGEGPPTWANTDFLAAIGRVDDITSQLDRSLTGSSMTELAEKVAAARGPEEGEGADVTVVDGPREGDVPDITVDSLGYQDDAQIGERLHVFATQSGDEYRLRTVEATLLCARGVSDGLCV